MDDYTEFKQNTWSHLNALHDEANGTNRSITYGRPIADGFLRDMIENKNKLKHERNKKRSIELMKHHPGYSCSDCFHGLMECCIDNLPNGCEFWFNADTGEYFPIEQLKKSRK